MDARKRRKRLERYLLVFIGLLSLAGCITVLLFAQVAGDAFPFALASPSPSPQARSSNGSSSAPPTGTPPSLPSVTPTPLPNRPPPASPTAVPAVRFAVIGDYGLAGPDLESVVGLIDGWAPDFIVTVGDNNYPDGEAETIDENVGQYFHAYISPYRGEYGEGAELNRFFPTLGNHDWFTAKGQPYFDYFDLPGNERYYDVLWDPVHVFALDSDGREPDGIGRSSVQAAWLREALSASTAPWKLVFFHHAPFSSAEHGSYPAMQWPFKDWGASAVIAGHDHVYERIMIDGFPYFTNGLGGADRYYFFLPVPGSAVRYREKYGAMLVEAIPERIVFRFITVDGEVIDSYTLEAQ